MSATSKIERRTLTLNKDVNKQIDIQVLNQDATDRKPSVRVFEGSASTGIGI